jgi:hypothetical protein
MSLSRLEKFELALFCFLSRQVDSRNNLRCLLGIILCLICFPVTFTCAVIIEKKREDDLCIECKKLC